MNVYLDSIIINTYEIYIYRGRDRKKDRNKKEGGKKEMIIK